MIQLLIISFTDFSLLSLHLLCTFIIYSRAKTMYESLRIKEKHNVFFLYRVTLYKISGVALILNNSFG